MSLALVNGDQVIEYPIRSTRRLTYGEQRVTVESTPKPIAPFCTYVEGMPARLDGKWVQTWNVAPVSLDEAKAQLLAIIATERYNREVGGVALPDGSIIQTDRESRSTFEAMYNNLRDEVISFVSWKGASGWVDINLEQAAYIRTVGVTYIRDVFAAERMHGEAVALLDSVGACIAYDTKVGWP